MSVESAIDHDELRPVVRGVLARECSPAVVRDAFDDPLGAHEPLWATMVDLGWTGIGVAEDHGGAGGSLADLAVVAAELGRALAPGAFVTSAVLAAEALAGGADLARSRWLPAVAAGSVRATVAVTGRTGRAAADDVEVVATPDGGGYRLEGTARWVPDAGAAQVVMVAATDPDGWPVLVAVDSGGVGATPVAMLDPTRRLGTVAFDGVRVEGDAVLARGDDAVRLLARLADVGAAFAAVDALGVAERVLELTTTYAGERMQFDRPIGSFQAVKHRCADMLISVETTRVAVDHAIGRLGDGDAPAEVSTAKAWAGDAAALVAGAGIQLHGGIGYTWEHDMHLFQKRAKLDQVLYGDSRWHLRRLADLIFSPAIEPT